MKQFQNFLLFAILILNLFSCKPGNHNSFYQINSLLNQEHYFKAQELYDSVHNNLNKPFQLYTEAVLYNAFNRLLISEERIDDLILQNNLPDSLLSKLYETKYDNSIKLHNYADAKKTVETLLCSYSDFLNEKEIADYNNSYKIWNALEDVPPMEINIRNNTTIRMKKDIAGLNTLNISTGQDSLFFIFDTGANLSTTTQSVAKQLKMKIIPIDIEVGTITGKKVLAQLAICDTLSMGNISWSNAIFLVMPDEALAFPQINYQIYGILGFPVIEALKEIRITRNGEFIVPNTETPYKGTSNMAMSGLTPLIYLDNKHFNFDTGADNSMLYAAFYNEHKQDIDNRYEQQKISFGGAGGHVELDGYVIDFPIIVNEKEVVLTNIHCLKEKISNRETAYGNIGQDLIQQFDTLILNFNSMFIEFK